MAIREELSLGLSNWKRGMDEARSDVRRFASDTNREMRSVGGRGGGGAAEGGMMGMLGGGIAAGVGAAFASIGGSTGVLMALKESLTVADDLADLTLALNESAEALQRVDFAGRQAASIGVDQIAKSMMRLERSLGDVENKAAAQALENLGISAERLAAMPLDEKILALSEAFQKARADGTGLNDIQDLMGRTAADLVPLFEQTGEALRGMFEDAPVLAEATVQEMAMMNDEIDAMMMKFAAMRAQSAAGLISSGKLIKDTFTVGFDQAIINRGATIIGFQVEANNRESARKESAEGMGRQREEKAAAAAEQKAVSDQQKQMENFEAAEGEANRDADRRRRAEAERRAREQESAEKQRQAQSERIANLSFGMLDPEEQMKILRDRIESSLGVSESREEIINTANAFAGAGWLEEAETGLKSLAQLEAIAGRQSGSTDAGGGAQGSFATLMDQIFGRGVPEQQLDKLDRSLKVQEDQARKLDAILTEMGKPAPRDIFTDFP